MPAPGPSNVKLCGGKASRGKLQDRGGMPEKGPEVGLKLHLMSEWSKKSSPCRSDHKALGPQSEVQFKEAGMT